jgi:hypothetical protein
VNRGGGGGSEKGAAAVRPTSVVNLGQMGRFRSRAAKEERGKGARGEKRLWGEEMRRGPGLVEAAAEEKGEKKLAGL